jgi:hypothetical protein
MASPAPTNTATPRPSAIVSLPISSDLKPTIVRVLAVVNAVHLKTEKVNMTKFQLSERQVAELAIDEF